MQLAEILDLSFVTDVPGPGLPRGELVGSGCGEEARGVPHAHVSDRTLAYHRRYPLCASMICTDAGAVLGAYHPQKSCSDAHPEPRGARLTDANRLRAHRRTRGNHTAHRALPGELVCRQSAVQPIPTVRAASWLPAACLGFGGERRGTYRPTELTGLSQPRSSCRNAAAGAVDRQGQTRGGRRCCRLLDAALVRRHREAESSAAAEKTAPRYHRGRTGPSVAPEAQDESLPALAAV